jgi:hypothetical protein
VPRHAVDIPRMMDMMPDGTQVFLDGWTRPDNRIGGDLRLCIAQTPKARLGGLFWLSGLRV